jgi:serine/threonine-protein kinase
VASIDSLSAETYFAWRRALGDGNYLYEEALVDSLCAMLIQGQRLYPNDAELAFLHAEVRSEYDRDVVIGEVDDRGTLARYDRAIALDSGFAPAYVRPITLSAWLDGAPRARRYIHAYLALTPADMQSQRIRLADDLLNPSRAASIDVGKLVDTLPPDALCEAVKLMRHIPDTAETVVRMGRALAARIQRDTLFDHASYNCFTAQVANGLQFRGHLRDAEQLAGLGLHSSRPAVLFNLARFNMLPVDSARAEFKQLLELAPKIRITKLYGWWAADGDTAAIRTYMDGFWALGDRIRTPSVDAMVRASIVAGRAHLALAKRDSVEALRVLTATRDTLQDCWYENRVVLVRLLAAAGRYREAANHLERRWPGTTSCSNGVDDIIWTMERARVFDRLGRRDEAIASYEFVAAAWRTADPELQPYVREAREAAKRLRDGARGATTLASSGIGRY